jgi:ubiquinone biosynthesis protein
VVVTRHALGWALGAAARRVPGFGRWMPPEPSGPQRARRLLEALGGSFIKFGQVLALQPDILPRRYCDAFFDLLDRMPPFDFAGAERIFREELGKAPQELFDSIDETPLASASIGQVHVAWRDGRKLAVKVQRPRARREFGGDIQLMKWAAGWIRRLGLHRIDWLAMSLDEFISWTGEELDFRAEARVMDQLATNSRDRRRERVPDVEWSLTTARILTAEFLEGTTLLQYLRSLEVGRDDVAERLAGTGFEPERFAENVLENFLHDVFHHGVFHADLHPANLLILPENTVGYVDFGISGVVSEYARYHLVATVMALTRADVDRAADHLLAIAELSGDSDSEGFRRELAAQSERWYRRDPGSHRLEKSRSYTEILLDTLRLSRQFRIVSHPEAVRYMRSVITLDGLIGRFAPALDRDRTLRRQSGELIESSPVSAFISFDQWVDWLWAGAQLMRDGPSRLDRALDRLERGMDPSPDSAPRRGHTRPAGRSLQLGVAAVALALLVVLFGESPRWGLNLFTAETAVVAGALGLLMREVLGWRPLRR